MTPEQINRAIAEWMGWKGVHQSEQHVCLMGKPPNASKGSILVFPVPNFHNDLNACHEVEGKLDDQHDNYIGALLDPVSEETCDLDPLLASWVIVHAPAPQRCEALLRTLNLWRE